MSDKVYIDVLYVQPMKQPELMQIEATNEVLEAMVGGEIDEYMPFDDDAVIVCNALAKQLELPPNRTIYDDYSGKKDIVHGSFLICYGPFESETYLSLTEELKKKYNEKFKCPEVFYMGFSGEILSKKLIPNKSEHER